MSAPIRILFVCLGNICRSPLAEGVFRSHVEAAGLAPHFEIGSAGTGVAILSANRPEWAIADLAAIAAGAIPTGLFTTCSPEQCRYVVAHTGARVAVVDGEEALGKLLEVRSSLPELRRIVRLDGDGGGPEVLSWRRLLELGEAAGESALERRLAAQRPDDVATLIYTSGTTGHPKGVELTHAGVVRLFRGQRWIELDRSTVMLQAASVAFDAMTLEVWGPLLSGATLVVVTDRIPTASLLRDITSAPVP